MAKLPMPFSNPSMQSYPGHQGMDYPQRTGTLVPANGAGVIINRDPSTVTYGGEFGLRLTPEET